MAAVGDDQLKDSVRKEYSESLLDVPNGGRLATRKEAPAFCGLPEFFCVAKDGAIWRRICGKDGDGHFRGKQH
eukprot:11171369-Lingulodinium_polyedra.AAC.1